MTREQAERERDRLAEEHPEATWLVAEQQGGWQVVRVGLKPLDSPTGEHSEAKPRPSQPDDPRPERGNNPYLF
jgi:hypothetical protein